MRRLSRLFFLLILLFVVRASLHVSPLPLTLSLPPLTGQVDRTLVEKAARRLSLIQNGSVERSYAIAFGFSPDGDKTRQGDGRTPEGSFRISRRNAGSRYHLSLGLDYPQAADRARAAVGRDDPGGDIMIHGQPNALPDGMMMTGDWIAGCIAFSNAEIREVWAVTAIGTVIEVRP